MDEARALAQRLAAGPSFALGMTKTLLNQELDLDFAAAIEAEAQGQAICMQTPVLPRGLRGVHVAATMIDAAALRRLAPRAASRACRTSRRALEPIAPRGEAGEVDERRRATRSAMCAELGLCRLLVPRSLGGEGSTCAPSVSRARRSPRRAGSRMRSSPSRGWAAIRSRSAATGRLGRTLSAGGVATATAIAAFALTEPEAGSDAGGHRDPRRRVMAATTSSTAPRCSSRTPPSPPSSSCSRGPPRARSAPSAHSSSTRIRPG